MEQNLSGTTGQTGSGGQEVTERAKQQGQQLAQQARHQAGELANRGGEQVNSQLTNQKHEASQRLTPIQTALRETAQQLRRQGQESTARYADQASDQVSSGSPVTCARRASTRSRMRCGASPAAGLPSSWVAQQYWVSSAPAS